ncbi:hypothetical protein [Salinibaculum rarum]|uniref:hypothetical protein n=1 Tax=Salinibaculum rarum TaxID=3058903 RepID=UPI00265DD430|nr:hypothetical protein [Salinibaculum sp. KK48]
MAPSPDRTLLDRSTDPTGLDERPDDLFVLVTGLYAASLLAPLATAIAARVVTDSGILYSTLLTVVVLTTVVAAVAVRRIRGLPERLGGAWYRWLPALLAPGLVGLAGVAVATAGSVSSTDFLLGVVAAIGGFGTGGVLGLMARSRHAKAVVADADQFSTWRAAWSDRRRRPIQALGVVLVGGGIVSLAVSVPTRLDILRYVANLVVPFGAGVVTVGQARTYTATAAGLEKQMPAARTLYEWDDFEGYTVAEDAIVLYRRAPWRLPIVCDRTDIDDEEAVIAALSRHLPRLPVV